MGNFKYTLQKNKQKILLGVAFITVIGAGFGMYTLINRPDTEVTEEVYEDVNMRKADYIFMVDKAGSIDLYGTEEEKVVDTLNLNLSNTLFARSSNLESIMLFGNNSFYEVSEKEGKLESEEVIKFDKKINDFIFTNKYIIGFSSDKFYCINRESSSIKEYDIANVESKVLFEDNLVYSIGNFVYSIDLTSNDKPISIDLGDKTEGLFVMNGKIISYNNFGSGNNITTILKLNADNLYIDYAEKHNNSNLSALTMDDDDDTIKFIDSTNKNNVILSSHYTMTVNEDSKNSKVRVSLADSQTELNYNADNTVSTKGYFYNQHDGLLNIFDLRAEGVSDTIRTDKEYFMPILK